MYIILEISFKSDNTLRVLSFDVNGLKNFAKCIDIKNKILYPENKKLAADIYTFQESRSTAPIEQSWRSAFPGQVVFAHGTNFTPGVV